MKEPASDFLLEWAGLLAREIAPGPVLDLACGGGQNGLHLARMGMNVICCDRSRPDLRQIWTTARKEGLQVRVWWTNLEARNRAPLPAGAFGAVLVFRYLHRPLIPEIRSAVRPGGFVIYETFCKNQTRFGRPRNPAHLLRRRELPTFFAGWEFLHVFEGELSDPPRAMARIVARKP